METRGSHTTLTQFEFHLELKLMHVQDHRRYNDDKKDSFLSVLIRKIRPSPCEKKNCLVINDRLRLRRLVSFVRPSNEIRADSGAVMPHSAVVSLANNQEEL